MLYRVQFLYLEAVVYELEEDIDDELSVYEFIESAEDLFGVEGWLNQIDCGIKIETIERRASVRKTELERTLELERLRKCSPLNFMANH